MNNKPICGEWHGNDVMPRENAPCIFKISVDYEEEPGEEEETLIGCRKGADIVRLNTDCDFVCDEENVVSWCYIDLN